MWAVVQRNSNRTIFVQRRCCLDNFRNQTLIAGLRFENSLEHRCQLIVDWFGISSENVNAVYLRLSKLAKFLSIKKIMKPMDIESDDFRVFEGTSVFQYSCLFLQFVSLIRNRNQFSFVRSIIVLLIKSIFSVWKLHVDATWLYCAVAPEVNEKHFVLPAIMV